MEPILIAIIAVTSAIVLLGVPRVASRLAEKRRRAAIAAAFRTIAENAVVTFSGNRCDVETDGAFYAVKVVPLRFGSELILTNRLYWCENDDPGNWKRSTKPTLVKGVAAFLEETPNTAKRIVRIALLYPTAHNVTRYLNESDVELVRPEKAVEGVHFVPFDRLKAFLKIVDQK
ncbi:MAG: hypothetical protein WC509_01530 [Candidatus Izemoplasmatales bacterium]